MSLAHRLYLRVSGNPLVALGNGRGTNVDLFLILMIFVATHLQDKKHRRDSHDLRVNTETIQWIDYMNNCITVTYFTTAELTQSSPILQRL